jgi:hypothetical protein
VVNVCPKLVRGKKVVWSDVCKLSKLIEDTFLMLNFDAYTRLVLHAVAFKSFIWIIAAIKNSRVS